MPRQPVWSNYTPWPRPAVPVGPQRHCKKRIWQNWVREGPRNRLQQGAPPSSGPDACELFLPSFSETGMLVDTSPLHEALRIGASSRPACVVGDKSTALMTSGRGLLRNVLFHGLRSALLRLSENSAAGRNLSSTIFGRRSAGRRCNTRSDVSFTTPPILP